ncbi:orotidine 5'-phosphate decarboxylase [candidate division WOR-3 bacterium]|nr:orotidine 5'-phosphate decarboxylase [candidate division WOR-3 bacterium]
MLNSRKRYLQIAFNYDSDQVSRILPHIPKNGRILIEAGTPYIKKEGLNGIKLIRQMWTGIIVADLKTLDGGSSEVRFAFGAGANAVTVLGSAPVETLNYFVEMCSKLRVYSMIDMLGVEDPLKVMLKLRTPPDVVVIHRGRDEETTRGKVIKYKQINKIRSKYDVFISAAGGIDLREARSAIFNGADIVVANIVTPNDPWVGISTSADVSRMAREFLTTIE